MKTDVIDIKSVWEVEQEILNVFDAFCQAHNISYSLGFGTLLGAIRHKGFIPWDDDIDIIMLRKDYDRFISLWIQKPVNGYVLQNEYYKNDDYPNNFCKLRKDHTAFIQNEKELKTKYHKGIFIDIFPVDRVAPQGISRRMQMLAFYLYMLYSREYTDGSNGLFGMIQKILLKLPHGIHTFIKRVTLKYMTKWNDNEKAELVIPCTAAFCKIYYPSNLFEKLINHPFNGELYSITANYDGFLKTMYKDYMKLPPERDRIWKHSPIYLSTTNNYIERNNRK